MLDFQIITPELTDFIKAVIWPITLVSLIVAYREPLRTLLRRLSESLVVRAIKVKAFGLPEIELGIEKAEGLINELVEEAFKQTQGLSEPRKDLYKKIVAASGRQKVEELIPHFQRYKPGERKVPTEELEDLRALRDRGLIRPRDPGQFERGTIPIVTRFGRLVDDLMKEAEHSTADQRKRS